MYDSTYQTTYSLEEVCRTISAKYTGKAYDKLLQILIPLISIKTDSIYFIYFYISAYQWWHWSIQCHARFNNRPTCPSSSLFSAGVICNNGINDSVMFHPWIIINNITKLLGDTTQHPNSIEIGIPYDNMDEDWNWVLPFRGTFFLMTTRSCCNGANDWRWRRLFFLLLLFLPSFLVLFPFFPPSCPNPHRLLRLFRFILQLLLAWFTLPPPLDDVVVFRISGVSLGVV